MALSTCHHSLVTAPGKLWDCQARIWMAVWDFTCPRHPHALIPAQPCHSCSANNGCESTEPDGTGSFTLSYRSLQPSKERKQFCIADAVRMRPLHYSTILSSWQPKWTIELFTLKKNDANKTSHASRQDRALTVCKAATIWHKDKPVDYLSQGRRGENTLLPAIASLTSYSQIVRSQLDQLLWSGSSCTLPSTLSP